MGERAETGGKREQRGYTAESSEHQGHHIAVFVSITIHLLLTGPQALVIHIDPSGIFAY